MKALQREITEKHSVFEQNGEVMCAGWARAPLFEYNKEQSKSFSNHSYHSGCFVNNSEVSLYLSIESSGHAFRVKIAVADLKRGGVICDCIAKKQIIRSESVPFEDEEFLYSDKRLQVLIRREDQDFKIACDFERFGSDKKLSLRLSLEKIYDEALSELAPFERNRRYYYLKTFAPQYISCGEISVGARKYSLDEASSRAYLDLARFSKPRLHNYQRLSADSVINGKRFSLCLASRVGDNRYGNENCFFVDGSLEKLSQINVKGTNGRLDRPFYFSAGYSALDITFKPFTINGEPMCADMDNTSVLFGRLYGEIKRADFAKPLVLDNTQAHLIFHEF